MTIYNVRIIVKHNSGMLSGINAEHDIGYFEGNSKEEAIESAKRMIVEKKYDFELKQITANEV